MRAALIAVCSALIAACGCGSSAPTDDDAGVAPDASRAQPVPADFRGDVIYLMLLDRFADGDPTNNRAGQAGCYDPDEPDRYHGGDLTGLKNRLDYLQELGVTAVWTTPVYRQTHCGYHGYWPAYDSSGDVDIEATFGNSGELTALIEELHARDMRFILDVIVNHAGYGAPIVESKPQWFHTDSRLRVRPKGPDVQAFWPARLRSGTSGGCRIPDANQHAVAPAIRR